jgi:hypothetical protein
MYNCLIQRLTSATALSVIFTDCKREIRRNHADSLAAHRRDGLVDRDISSS